MQRIPIIDQEELFLDLNQEALVNGKVEILDPISNNPLDVWTYTDAEYTIATNPIRLSIEGRATQTIFSDRLSYIRVYKFLGIDEHNQEMFEFVRDYLAGFDENSESREYIIGMEALKDLDPTINSAVNVIGYYELGDCETRQYVWDPNSQLDPDGGYVVGSNVSSTGRWILQFNGEYLPSSYYGVWPGKTANINALLSYVEVINGKKTAPGVWFVPGDYDVSTNLQTTKRLLLDAGTTFACQYFYCGNLRVVGEPQSAICDFDFYDPEQEAHSSWFKTMAGYLTCGAKKFIFDAKDNFLNHTLQNANYVLQNKIIEGQTRLPVTYNGDNCRITFNNCVINAERIFNSTDRLGFAYTDIKDNWWNNPASVDWNTTVYARSTNLNRIQLDNFTNVNAYVNAKVADGATFVDLAGREIGSLSFTGGLIELRNAYVTNSLTISKPSSDIYLKHVKCGNVYVSSRYLTIEDNCEITMSEPSCSAIWMDNSTIYGSSWSNKNCQIIATNCFIGFGLNWATENELDTAYLEFVNCKFQENVSFYLKRIIMKNCVTMNNTIKIYPRKVNSQYYLGPVDFENNILNSVNPLEFTKHDILDGRAQDDVYECIAQWTLLNNTFTGNEEGVRARFWHHRTGSNYGKTFLKFGPDVGHSLNIKGNTGNCPDDFISDMNVTCGWNEDHDYWKKYNNSSSDIWCNPESTKRCFTTLRGTGGTDRLINQRNMYLGGIVYNATSPSEIVKHIITFIGYRGVYEHIENGDLFLIIPVFMGSPGEHDNYARIVDHIQ